MLDQKTGQFIRYQHVPGDSTSLKYNTVYSLFEDSQHRLWVGTETGLCLFVRKNNSFDWTASNLPQGPRVLQLLNNKFVTAILEDSQNRLWFGTYQGDVTCWDPTSGALSNFGHNLPDPLNFGGIHDFIEDEKEGLWIRSFNNGLIYYHFQTGTFTTYQHDPSDSFSLSNNSTQGLGKVLFIDQEKNLWVGIYLRV